MSTDFKPGDTLRVIDADFQLFTDNPLFRGQVVTVEAIEPTGNVQPKGFHRVYGFRPERFEKVEETPTPLDPSKVKVGDTVTLTRGKASVGDTVTLTRGKASVIDTVADVDWSDMGGVGPLIHLYETGEWVRWTGPTAWTLTAHTPAPEPEPEWKPGTVARATVRFQPDVLVVRAEADALSDWISVPAVEGPADPHPERYHGDSNVTDVRPLVVIDPASVDDEHRLAAIIREVDGNHDKGASALAEAILERLAR